MLQESPSETSNTKIICTHLVQTSCGVLCVTLLVKNHGFATVLCFSYNYESLYKACGLFSFLVVSRSPEILYCSSTYIQPTNQTQGGRHTLCKAYMPLLFLPFCFNPPCRITPTLTSSSVHHSSHQFTTTSLKKPFEPKSDVEQ